MENSPHRSNDCPRIDFEMAAGQVASGQRKRLASSRQSGAFGGIEYATFDRGRANIEAKDRMKSSVHRETATHESWHGSILFASHR
jgi:hypothetical protein